MELHEDFSSASIWESFSSEECGSGSSSLLPELCSPDNSSWQQVPSGKLSLQEDCFDQEFALDKSLFPVKKPDHHRSKSFDPINPESPCSPLLFSLPAVPQELHYGALHMQIQQLPSFTSIRSGDHKRGRGIKQELHRDQDEDCPPAKRISSSLEAPKSSGEPPESKACEASNSFTVASSSPVAIGPALNTDGKPRAKRGSATDPQSVYARQRRERINERLRALQGLVPNGAKVDIVTMLEEAINYVKFLQLQVKLLSSDEYWMYAPTTYNGMNISLGMHLGMQSYLKARD